MATAPAGLLRWNVFFNALNMPFPYFDRVRLIGCHSPNGWGACGALPHAAINAAIQQTTSVLMG
ncbi:hypothetical protein [Ralstonia solanacearum]|uniref:hypothetical protein n=1 Tax=Ralstonia solanacearum TaxID=305 RepID=UPI0018C26EC1|nr:hypothetical protein [Ralstonia solanacearum]